MNQWVLMELSNLPPVNQAVGLYLMPRRRERAWRCDFGRVYLQEGTNVPYWESAFGIGSRLDGMRIQALLRDYEICFASLPPLVNGRVPPVFAHTIRKG